MSSMRQFVLVSEDQYLLDFIGDHFSALKAEVRRPQDWDEVARELRGKSFQTFLLDESRVLGTKQAPIHWLREEGYQLPLMIKGDLATRARITKQLAEHSLVTFSRR